MATKHCPLATLSRFHATLVTIFFLISHTTPLVKSSTFKTTTTQNAITQVVQKVCSLTSDPSFCVSALYTDPRTPGADSYASLAFIAVRLALTNATTTQGQINHLLTAAPAPQWGPLRRCKDDYGKALLEFEAADNDLNSETYFDLDDEAGIASRAVDDCQAAFGGAHASSPLDKNNRDTKAFSEIITALGKLLTGGGDHNR